MERTCGYHHSFLLQFSFDESLGEKKKNIKEEGGKKERKGKESQFLYCCWEEKSCIFLIMTFLIIFQGPCEKIKPNLRIQPEILKIDPFQFLLFQNFGNCGEEANGDSTPHFGMMRDDRGLGKFL